MAKKPRKRRKWKKVLMLAPEQLSEYLSEDWQKRFNNLQLKNMVCPAWEDCNKKSCIEQYVCMDPTYWSAYWKKMAGLKTGTRAANRARKKSAKALYFKDRPACVKSGDWCDKKDSCAVLGQCIVTIPRIAANPALIESLKGKLDTGAVIKRLREHDPEPMASYYPKIKSK